MEATKELVVNCIFCAIDSVSDRYDISKNPHSTIFGKGGSIDSLGLVAFIVAVEEELEKVFKKKLTLADQKALNQKVYPFGSIDALSGYVVSLLEPSVDTTSQKKVVIVDLDNTIWDGIAGEDGIDGIKIYGKFRDLQVSLKKLKESGILLAACSKNNYDTAMNVIANHPDMVLGVDDFISTKIGWGQKYLSIEEIAKELNLGTESFVFIDDDPRERDAVKVFHPEVYVSDKLDDFMVSTPVTREDLLRVQMYKTEKDRQASRGSAGSVDDWLTSLDTVVTVTGLTDTNADRVIQMINKTNQMNLSTRRMNKEDFITWYGGMGTVAWVLSVRDKFGDAGIVGVVTAIVDNDTIDVVDFILSCRVMNRKIEETMAYIVVDYARKNDIKNIVAQYVSTPRNGPCLSFWKRSGFIQSADTFTYSSKFENILPSCIKLEEQCDGK